MPTFEGVLSLFSESMLSCGGEELAFSKAEIDCPSVSSTLSWVVSESTAFLQLVGNILNECSHVRDTLLSARLRKQTNSKNMITP